MSMQCTPTTETKNPTLGRIHLPANYPMRTGHIFTLFTLYLPKQASRESVIRAVAPHNNSLSYSLK